MSSSGRVLSSILRGAAALACGALLTLTALLLGGGAGQPGWQAGFIFIAVVCGVLAAGAVWLLSLPGPIRTVPALSFIAGGLGVIVLALAGIIAPFGTLEASGFSLVVGLWATGLRASAPVLVVGSILVVAHMRARPRRDHRSDDNPA